MNWGIKVRWIWAIIAPLAICACSKPVPVTEAPLQVSIAQVGVAAPANFVIGSGVVAYRLETPLGFTSAGRIARLGVYEGDRVSTGQLLAALDPAPVDADLSVANAELVRANAELHRAEALFAQGWIIKARVENARAAAQAAAARVRSAGFQAQNARITAPTAGEVLSRAAEPGQVIAAGTPVLVLGEARGGLVIRVALNDQDRGRIALGASAQIEFAALPAGPLQGSVIELGGRAVPTTGAFLAEVLLPSNPLLRSGMIGTARIAANPPSGPQPLVIPPTALFAARAGEAFVYVVGADNVVRLRKISIGPPGDTGAAVLGGLSPGEWVAVAALERLRDGLKVVPVGRTR